MRRKLLIAGIILIMIMVSACSCGDTNASAEADPIVGEWCIYGYKYDSRIVPYTESTREEADAVSEQSLLFKGDGEAILRTGNVELSGKYEKKGDTYLITVSFYDENDPARFNCYLEEDYLIVEHILPEAYSDYDPGDPTVYKKK